MNSPDRTSSGIEAIEALVAASACTQPARISNAHAIHRVIASNRTFHHSLSAMNLLAVSPGLPPKL
jgi:hypothetical protein